ncbi:MAG: ABC transporter permease [Clostridia bacterium]|nr:ABC transporter permease [Clostridia bacterium]
MKKFFTVFKFEYSNLVKSRTFIVLTLLVVIGAGIGLSWPRISELVSGDKETPVEEGMTIAVINDSVYDDELINSTLQSSMPEYKISLIEGTQDDAREMVKTDEYGYIIMLKGENEYTLVTKSLGIDNSLSYRLDGILLYNYRSYLLDNAGLDAEQSNAVLQAQMEYNLVETGKSQTNSLLYTNMIVIAMYMIIIIYGQMVATSVATEKSSRAMEVLVTTVDPVRMMFGKVLGIGTAALTQVAVIAGSTILFYNLNSDYLATGFISTLFNMPAETIILSILLVILGFFVYAFLYAAVGSLVSRIEDVSQGVLPITFISIASYMIVMISMPSGNVDSLLMKICTFFPLTSPYALVARMAMTDVGLWQSIGAVALLLVTCIVIGYLAAMVYRLGVLMYGKPPKMKEVFKLLKDSRKS